jgi:transposase
MISAEKTEKEQVKTVKYVVLDSNTYCSNCGAQLVHEGRCTFCPSCGWSKCDI